ncbi:2-oxoacid:ferredoxin oxidoreductase subunit gamma [bacterium]|nr:MAG: 2-oxoacid:ferredoxin oxidoreductase subunit gamma [bacterium]
MKEQIIISGSGGHGIMLAGKVLAEAALREGKHVTWLPAYGAEVRGGAAYCMVIISDEPIGSPYIDKADTLIAMNEPSLSKFSGKLKPKGLLIINSSLVKIKTANTNNILKFPFMDIALTLGNSKVANMVVLGAFIAKKKIVSIKNTLSVINDFAKSYNKELFEINRKALLEGEGLIK